MQRTLLIYESKYGATEKIVKYLAPVLGPANYCTTDQFKDSYRDFDFIVIGSPVYSGKLDPEIYNFIENNREWLNDKPLALFSVSLSPEDGMNNLDEISGNIKNTVSKKALGGTLKLSAMTEEDSKALDIFSQQVGFPLKDMDNFNLEEVTSYALELKEIKENLIPPAPQREEFIDKFLTSHNTCTLSTSYQNRVRSTPIEYNYFNGFIYLLSEGGEKFANLPLNNQVSVAVYEDYTGFNNLAGMQITGTSEIISEDTPEYEDVLRMKGLKIDFIKRNPVKMNMIKITISKVEFLYSEFKKLGYEAKQIQNFKKLNFNH
ncbi:flavodoxin domain-containing protein [uncultured Methanobacterium sp.]|uniref:flavodoxin domain-containing protein n=1 Tax=uncultured Methanobacterium sp. TaxID=176306 RepID=UPI002AA81C86|nr:flavodoxin domain-containing protein [uncultured Methanobacterium sp.]